MRKLNQILSKLSFSKFLLTTALLLFLSDLINITYVNLYFLPEKVTLPYIQNILRLRGQNIVGIDMSTLNEIRSLLINTLSNIFIFFFFYHVLIYFYYFKNKSWPKKYVKGYALTGTLLTAFEIPMLIYSKSFLWSFLMSLTTLIYLFVFFGLRYYKLNANN